MGAGGEGRGDLAGEGIHGEVKEVEVREGFANGGREASGEGIVADVEG